MYNNNKKGNYDKKKTYDRPQNLKVRIKLLDFCSDKNGREFNRESLTGLIGSCSDIFNKISIGVSCAKSIIFSDTEAKGSLNVGYIESFNKETEEFDITIYNKSIDALEKYGFDNLYILPRMIIKDSRVKTITAFDLVVQYDHFEENEQDQE